MKKELQAKNNFEIILAFIAVVVMVLIQVFLNEIYDVKGFWNTPYILIDIIITTIITVFDFSFLIFLSMVICNDKPPKFLAIMVIIGILLIFIYSCIEAW
jgi:hypothetical protein